MKELKDNPNHKQGQYGIVLPDLKNHVIGSAEYAMEAVKRFYNIAGNLPIAPFNRTYRNATGQSDDVQIFNDLCHKSAPGSAVNYVFYGNVEISYGFTAADTLHVLLKKYTTIKDISGGTYYAFNNYKQYNGIQNDGVGNSLKGVLLSDIQITTLFNNAYAFIQMDGFLIQTT